MENINFSKMKGDKIMSEERTNELMEMENEDLTVIELEENGYSGGSGLGKILIGAVVGVIAGGAALAYKNKDKIKEKYQEKQIAKCTKKLEKLGCTVVRDEYSEEDFEEDVFEEEIIEEETE